MSRWRSLRFEFTAMASPCSLEMDGQDERAMRQAAAAAIAEVQRIEQKFSRYNPDSIISQINRAAGGAPVEVDEETGGLLDFAESLWNLSDGLFDISSGVLRRAWDFKKAALPQTRVLNEALACVGWKNVVRNGMQVQLARAGMELDFGGFGKEYAADRAALVLLKHGIAHALVNLGGDLHALGKRGHTELKNAPWEIAIQHPRPEGAEPHASLARLSLARGGLATSGDYERFFVHEGQRYCHVLNPLTGWPVSHWQSVSVLATNTTTAGALCTIAMLKGAQAIDWLNTQNVRYLAVRQDGHVVRSAAA